MLEGYILEYCQKNNILIDALIELSYECNLRCKHCYISNRTKKMPIEKAIYIIDKLYDEGTINLSLTGGEILQYPHFEEIYMYAKSKGFIIELKTNGLLIDEYWADLFGNNLPEEINITVYGLTNEDYFKFTGRNKGFDKLKRALDLLHERNVPFSLSVISTTFNYYDIINGRYKSIFEQYNVDFEFDYDILNGLDGNPKPLQYRLDPEQIVNIENNAFYYLDAIEREYAEVKNRSKSPFVCPAGISKICIDPDGKASSCMFDNKFKFDMHKESWQDLKKKLLARNKKINMLYRKSKCSSCTTGLLCRICPLKTDRLAPIYGMKDKCRISELRHSLIESLKETYKLPVNSDQLSEFRNIDFELSIQNFGVERQKDNSADSYFTSISNPDIDYIVNGVSVTGSKGKSVFYIPVLDDVLSENLNIAKGHALKIIRDIDFLGKVDVVEKLNKIKDINEVLFSNGVSPKLYDILVLRNKKEMEAFNGTKLVCYPSGTYFYALEVQHLESVEFGESGNYFKGNYYSNDSLIKVITDYINSLSLVPNDLWVGNLLNTKDGIMLIDLFNWGKCAETTNTERK